MFFRSLCALIALTCISLGAIAIEKQSLAVKREISLKHYEIQHLKEARCRALLKTQVLGAPPRLLQEWQAEHAELETATAPASAVHAPLLEWRLRRTGTP